MGSVARTSIRRRIKSTLRGAPLVWRLYGQFWGFEREGAAFRGQFRSFEDARKHAPKHRPIGHGGFIERARARGNTLPGESSGRELGDFPEADKAAASWLADAIRDLAQAGPVRVFDIGGNFGGCFFAYARVIRYPADIVWEVCEIPEIVENANAIEAVSREPRLRFTTAIANVRGASIVYAAGAAQYLDDELPDVLERERARPAHVIVQRTPFTDGRAFVTLQNLNYGIVPYRVSNRANFISQMKRLGYELIEENRLQRALRVPSRFSGGEDGFWGLWFRLSVGSPSGGSPEAAAAGS